MVRLKDMTAAHIPPSALLGALSQAFAYPWDGLAETTRLLSAYAESPEGALPFQVSAREALKAAEAFEDRTAEQLAYTRLFIGSFKMEAPPYASFYLEEAHTLNGRVAAEVEAVYAQFGLKLGPGEIAPPDHIRFLLAFLALLAQRFEETGEQAFAQAYADFRDDYLLTWVDQFECLVDRYAEHPYYPALVALTVESVKGGGGVSCERSIRVGLKNGVSANNN